MARKLAEFESVHSASVKAYLTVFDRFAMGEGAGPGFVHCTVSILTGRPPDLQRAISQGMFEELRGRFPESDRRGFSFTLELREMERDTYQKRP